MPLAQSILPAIDMLVLTFLVGFGLAAAVFVPLLRREHRRGGKRAVRPGRSHRTRSGASPAAGPARTQPRSGEPALSPAPRGREEHGAAALPDAEAPQASPGWADAERLFGTTTSKWEKRVDLCVAECAVRFGRARARLLNVTGELGIE